MHERPQFWIEAESSRKLDYLLELSEKGEPFYIYTRYMYIPLCFTKIQEHSESK